VLQIASHRTSWRRRGDHRLLGRGPACVGAEERGELAAACVVEALNTLTF
jgi:hypothetical protein